MPATNEVPLMEFEADAAAPILRYDVPSPSSYEGRSYIELDISEESFSEKAKTKPTFEDFIDANQEEIYEYLSTVSKEELERQLYSVELDKIEGGGNPVPRGPRLSAGTLSRLREKTEKITVAIEKIKEEDTISVRYEIFKSRLEIALLEDRFPTFYRAGSGRLRLRFVKVPERPEPRLMLIETYKLTTYPGDYGAGTTVKTFSLLPGEETEISIKTYRKTATTTKEASSILDSYTEDKADEFETGIQEENSRRDKVDESFSYHAEAEASGNWGTYKAKVSGGVSGSSNSSREEFSKNVMNATEKHSQKASAKREVNIDTSYERSEEEGEETAVMRRINNLNASRTLNFVFRQMNQEFHSILHMTDLRLAFYNGYPGSMKEFSLSEFGDLVSEEPEDSFMKEEVTSNGTTIPTPQFLETLVIGEYGSERVFDYQGNPKQLVEEKTIPAMAGGTDSTYLRVIPPRKDASTKEQIGRQKYVMREAKKDPQGNVIQPEDVRYVDGIILAAKRLTMRTDGVIVESLLGKAKALDKYALNTQIEVLRDRRLSNDRIEKGLDLVEKLREDGKIDEAVKAYQAMFVPQPTPEQP